MPPRTKPLNPFSRTALAIRVPGPPIDGVSSPPDLAVDTSGFDNLVTIKVPADDTVLTMGAGKPSGFHMATDKHADMTARSPATTICLGEAQDVGAVDGFSVYSEGQKDEHIVDKVNIHYEDDVKEQIDGKLDVKVAEDATYDYGQKLDTSSEERTEKVTGDWKATVTGGIEFTAGENIEMKAKANHNVWVQGSENKTVFGFTRETRIGGENKQIVGQKTEVALAGAVELFAGGKQETFVGAKHEVLVGGKNELHVSYRMKIVAGADEEIEALKKRAHALEKANAALRLEKLEIAMHNREVEIDGLSMLIIK